MIENEFSLVGYYYTHDYDAHELVEKMLGDFKTRFTGKGIYFADAGIIRISLEIELFSLKDEKLFHAESVGDVLIRDKTNVARLTLHDCIGSIELVCSSLCCDLDLYYWNNIFSTKISEDKGLLILAKEFLATLEYSDKFKDEEWLHDPYLQ